MDELFKQFARGDIPNVIELMAAISELSDYWPGNDCLDCRTNSCENPVEKPDKIQHKNHAGKSHVKMRQGTSRI